MACSPVAPAACPALPRPASTWHGGGRHIHTAVSPPAAAGSITRLRSGRRWAGTWLRAASHRHGGNNVRVPLLATFRLQSGGAHGWSFEPRPLVASGGHLVRHRTRGVTGVRWWDPPGSHPRAGDGDLCRGPARSDPGGETLFEGRMIMVYLNLFHFRCHEGRRKAPWCSSPASHHALCERQLVLERRNAPSRLFWAPASRPILAAGVESRLAHAARLPAHAAPGHLPPAVGRRLRLGL